MMDFRVFSNEFIKKLFRDLELPDDSSLDFEYPVYAVQNLHTVFKKQYFKLAKVYHPDKPTHDDEKFNRAKEAYETLILPQDQLLSKIQELRDETLAEQEFNDEKAQLENYLRFFKLNERYIREYFHDSIFVSLIYLVRLNEFFTDENDCLHKELLETCKKIKIRLQEALVKVIKNEYFSRPTFARRRYLNSRFNTMKHEYREIDFKLTQFEETLLGQIERNLLDLDLAALFKLTEKVCEVEYKIYQGFVTKDDIRDVYDEVQDLERTFFSEELLTIQIHASPPDAAASGGGGVNQAASSAATASA